MARQVQPAQLLVLMQLVLGGAGAQETLVTYGARAGVPHWTYRYAGHDWTALEDFPVCRAAAQSPINVPDNVGVWACADYWSHHTCCMQHACGCTAC